MPIELTGEAKRETRGMKTRVVFRLNMAPSKVWLKLFGEAAGVHVANYPREMFQFDRDSAVCEFLGPRDSEVLEALRLYIADTNTQVEKTIAARKAATNPRLARQELEAKKRQTMMLGRELFDDGPEAEE